jgi:hypothetical protein
MQEVNASWRGGEIRGMMCWVEKLHNGSAINLLADSPAWVCLSGRQRCCRWSHSSCPPGPRERKEKEKKSDTWDEMRVLR